MQRPRDGETVTQRRGNKYDNSHNYTLTAFVLLGRSLTVYYYIKYIRRS